MGMIRSSHYDDEYDRKNTQCDYSYTQYLATKIDALEERSKNLEKEISKLTETIVEIATYINFKG